MYTTTPGAVIRYNVGSTAPTIISGILYDQNNPPTLTSSSTIKAIAYMPDGSQPASNVVTGSYTFQTVVKPTITATGSYPNSGSTICTNNTITITTTTGSATIRYNLTTNGTMPTVPTTINSGIAYTGPINLAQYNNKTVKIRAMAFRNDMNPSAAAYAYYDVLSVGSLPKPKITCTGTINGSSKTVAISLPQQNCTTVPGTASILYRQYPYESNPIIPPLNGFMPVGWSSYSSSFTITSSKDVAAVLKAFPTDGYGDVVIKSCCVGSGCLQAIEEAIIK